MDRTFSIAKVSTSNGDVIKVNKGRFVSKMPHNAVKKAFTRVSREHDVNDLNITIMDNKSLKKYKYHVSKVKKNTDVIINGKKVTFTHDIKVKSLNV